MTALVSFPQVLGHEVVGTSSRSVRRCRSGASASASCSTRGCRARRAGSRRCASGASAAILAQCTNFTRGSIAPGIHHGNSADATGGFAPLLPAHESQCIPIPDDVSFEEARCSPIRSRSRCTPPCTTRRPTGHGAGLRLRHARLAQHRHPARALPAGARSWRSRATRIRRGWRSSSGRSGSFPGGPIDDILAVVSQETGAEPLQPWYGRPMLNGGVDVVYDSVGSPESVEVGVRITRSRGRIVVTGVEMPEALRVDAALLQGDRAHRLQRLRHRGDRRPPASTPWSGTSSSCAPSASTSRRSSRTASVSMSNREVFMTCYDQGKSKAR